MLKKKLLPIYFFLSEQIGIDPLTTWASVRGAPQFVRDLIRIRRMYKGKIVLTPCLGDRFKNAGSARNEYFVQDLLVAQKIFCCNPDLHVDVGSRIDGFVAHVASFRSLEVIDIRPVDSIIPGVKFWQGDLMSDDIINTLCVTSRGYCDSLSCLHAIEHFGLGRYGDPVNPFGYEMAIKNLSKLIKTGGNFYLSAPIGAEHIKFNANWIFDPRTLLHVTRFANLSLVELTVIDQQGNYRTYSAPSEELLKSLGKLQYNLGLFLFVKCEPGVLSLS